MVFRVYYSDGNQRLFEAADKKTLREYLVEQSEDSVSVIKIELAKEYSN